MEPLLKYIIYFLLGIICYYLLKEDLIENYLDPDCHSCKKIHNYYVNDGECTATNCSNTWTESQINAYIGLDCENDDSIFNFKTSCSQGSDSHLKLDHDIDHANSKKCDDSENNYHSICFNASFTEELCESRCNRIKECGAYSFNGKCCLYKQGYNGTVTEGTDNGSKCYSKLECEPDSNSDINCICGNTSCIGVNKCENGSCSAGRQFIDYRAALDPCNDETASGLCKCGTEDGSYTIAKSGICDIGTTCSNGSCVAFFKDNDLCPYLDAMKNDMKNDSDIIQTSCYCDWNDGRTNVQCQGKNVVTGKYNYCNASNLICEELLQCNASNTLIKKACKYTDGEEVKMCRINHIYNGTTCRIISKCTDTDESQIITSGHECFCKNNKGDSYFCGEGNKCSASGCHGKGCPESYTRDESSKCIPSDCEIYSDTNTTPINGSCVCTSNSEILENNICEKGSYCLGQEYGVNKGCKVLPKVCTDDTLINASCVCPHEISDPQPYVCGKGNYCSENHGCYKIDCPGQKINPDNKLQCIDNDHEKDLIERFTDELIEIFDSFINIFK
jgi:hypothetical protein